MDQTLFLETLKAIVTVAKTENNYMTQKQVKKYMKDSGLELDEDKFTFIYQYLGENGVAVEGFHFKPVTTQLEENKKDDFNEVVLEEKENEKSSLSSLESYVTGKKETITTHVQNNNKESFDNNAAGASAIEEEEISEEDSIYLKMYLADLEEIPVLSENEKLTLWTEMKNGNESAKMHLMNGYFHEVADIAKEYRNKGVNLEDLIQEGNMSLLQVFDSIKELDTMEQVNGFLKDSIKEGIEHLIDTEVNDLDWEHTVLAKVNLIHEAAKHLAKELGRAATVQELAQYTKMSEEEIEDAKRLSKDVL